MHTLIKRLLLALGLAGLLTAGALSAQQSNVTNAVVIAALQAMGLFGSGYANGDTPVWVAASFQYQPSSAAGGTVTVSPSTCAAPGLRELGALTTGIAFAVTPEIIQCLAGVETINVVGTATSSKQQWWSNVGHGVTDIAPTNVPGYIGGDTGFSIVGLNGPGDLTTAPIRTLSVSNDKTSTTPGFLVRSLAKNGTGIQPLDVGVPLFAVAGYPDFAFVNMFEVRGYSTAAAKTGAGVYSILPYVSTFAGTAALSPFNFGTANSGFYQVAAGNVAATGGKFRWDKSTFNNGASAAANQTFYGLAQINTWGADSGMEIRGRGVTSQANAALELNGWVRDAASAFAAVQLYGVYNSTPDGVIYMPAAAPVVDICNNQGVAPCDNRMWRIVGNGVVTHNVWDLPNGSGIQTTSQAGYKLTNPFAATVGIQAQWSPGLDFVGSAWKANATAAAQANTLREELQAIPGAAATTFTFVWKGAAAGAGAFTNLLTLSSAGALTATGDLIGATGSYVSGVASGYKVARGSTALDGSNPTTVATGLTTVVSCTGTLLRNSAVSAGTAFLTHAAASGANVDWYGWVLAGSASVGTETFEWVCVGT